MVQSKNTSDTRCRRILRVIAIFAVALVICLIFMHKAKAMMPPTNLPMVTTWQAITNSQLTAGLMLSDKVIQKNPVTEKKEYVVYHLVYANVGDNRIYHLDTFEDEDTCFNAAKSDEYRDFVFEQFGDDNPKLFCQSSKRQSTD